MSPAELNDAMRFGSASPLESREVNDLGRFGLGMKTASISQCRRLTVISLKEGRISGREWDLEKMAESKSDEWNLYQLEEDEILADSQLTELINHSTFSCQSGTVVMWRNLDFALVGEGSPSDEQRFNEMLDSSRGHLETVFHRYLSPDPGHSSLHIDFNGTELEAFNPFGPSIPARQELPEEKIILNGGAVRVQPYVLPHRSKVSAEDYQNYAGEDGYFQNQGFYIYRQRRLIVKSTWFRLIKKEELNKLIRVRVDIPNSLDHLWHINVNKSQVQPPESVRKELKKIIKRIEGAGKLVYTRKATKLKNPVRIPVWRREIFDGKIRYRVNLEHPLIQSLLDNLPPERAQILESGITLIEQSFPFEACHSDVANDNNEIEANISDEQTIRVVCFRVLNALRECGFEGDELRSQLMRTEIPGASQELINEIVEEQENARH